MRFAQNSRIVSVGGAGLHGSPVSLGTPQRLSVPTPPQPPPPPPPYPGPPPPYPGSANQQVIILVANNTACFMVSVVSVM